MAKSKSKFAGVLDGLAPLPPEDASYQTKVEAVKDNDTRRARRLARIKAVDTLARFLEAAPVEQRDPQSLVSQLAHLRLEKELIAALAYDNNLHLEAINQMIVASQEAREEGWGMYGVADNALRTPSGDTVRIDHEPYGQVKDKEAFRLWCVAPAHVCMTCGEREGSPWHDDPVIAAGDPQNHRFKPGGGMENKMMLWPTTMNAIVKERLLAGEAQPDGTEVFLKTKVVYTEAKS